MQSRRLMLHSILMLALLARSAVVPGYMPGSGGGPLALCPEGLPERVAVRLFEPTSHAHHNHGTPGEPEPTPHSGGSPAECALGAGWIALGPPAIDITGSAPAETVLPAAGRRDRILPATRTDFQARAPPRHLPHA